MLIVKPIFAQGASHSIEMEAHGVPNQYECVLNDQEWSEVNQLITTSWDKVVNLIGSVNLGGIKQRAIQTSPPRIVIMHDEQYLDVLASQGIKLNDPSNPIPELFGATTERYIAIPKSIIFSDKDTQHILVAELLETVLTTYEVEGKGRNQHYQFSNGIISRQVDINPGSRKMFDNYHKMRNQDLNLSYPNITNRYQIETVPNAKPEAFIARDVLRKADPRFMSPEIASTLATNLIASYLNDNEGKLSEEFVKDLLGVFIREDMTPSEKATFITLKISMSGQDDRKMQRQLRPRNSRNN